MNYDKKSILFNLRTAIKVQCKEEDVDKQTLANLANIMPERIDDIENGRANGLSRISFPRMIDIANILSIDLAQIIRNGQTDIVEVTPKVELAPMIVEKEDATKDQEIEKLRLQHDQDMQIIYNLTTLLGGR